MNLSDLSNLDFGNAGSWPGVAKAIAIILLCGAVLGAGYWYDTRHQWEAYKKVQRQEGELKQVFEKKQHKAANLEAYRQQMVEMKESFGAMLRQLPGKTEVAGLLVDVSQTGLASGLEFELFKPENEQRKEFYAELPIRMRVVGTYHQFGDFVSGVAALPRIVTLHDYTISKRGGSDRLVMDVTAKTYRYLDEGGQ
jgi:type IV pilus assembly protein PilO